MGKLFIAGDRECWKLRVVDCDFPLFFLCVFVPTSELLFSFLSLGVLDTHSGNFQSSKSNRRCVWSAGRRSVLSTSWTKDDKRARSHSQHQIELSQISPSDTLTADHLSSTQFSFLFSVFFRDEREKVSTHFLCHSRHHRATAEPPLSLSPWPEREVVTAARNYSSIMRRLWHWETTTNSGAVVSVLGQDKEKSLLEKWNFSE